jgi:beta-lactamase regulating signal transducer with metallopeptidase domain
MINFNMGLAEMSVTAIILIVSIIIIRALFVYKLPKRTFVILWGIVMLRLTVPISYTLPDKTSQILPVQSNYTLYEFNGITKPNENSISHSSIMTTEKDGNVQQLSLLVFRGWFLGTTTIAFYFIFGHLKARKEYKTALPINNHFINEWLTLHKLKRKIAVKQSDKIHAPLTYGVFRPIILFPKSIVWSDEESLRLVLAHEYTHIKRFDIIAKWLLAVVLCLHWFNPFVWAMYILANRDIELSCDENVINAAHGDNKKSVYAQTLIKLEEQKNGFTPLFNHFAKNAIEERLVSIMKIKKTSFICILLAVALVSIAGFTLLASSGKINPDYAFIPDIPTDTSPDSTPEIISDFNLDALLSILTDGVTTEGEDYLFYYYKLVDDEERLAFMNAPGWANQYWVNVFDNITAERCQDYKPLPGSPIHERYGLITNGEPLKHAYYSELARVCDACGQYHMSGSGLNVPSDPEYSRYLQ